ncbi:type I-D CRISPR-associated protein Cas5/Csc1 [Flammeovirga sp. EKP202]|uniref:type I-D CRISPR-associated protein Cas5/Csc1 n=1 Tax=Flammeovirga sp. EKP202 TaxID=2770592 RepID=UPI00165EE023|nr:type I-D CRISPR-associated protein Cas5/Csc1 [Flammeovirga sp. EKP202]MBD0405055.1 type I-D CRISPR-associated protein Cas5/Csc1 [Flammeovirga sp. EKP202]
MHVYTIELTLLNHLFYNTENSNGVYTAPFIGDLALTYALRKVLVENWETPKYRRKPFYQEIKDWGFYVSVATPVDYTYTEVYTRNTLFNVDGFVNTDAITKSSKSPYKTLFYTQGVAVGSVFECQIFSREPLEIPSVLRVGNGRETLVSVKERTKKPDTLWLNIFTQKEVFNNLEKVADLIQNEPYEKAYVLEQYVLLKYISPDTAFKIMEDSLQPTNS